MFSFIKKIGNLIIDVLFPISIDDKKLFSYTPEFAYTELPRAFQTPIENTYSIFTYKDKLVTRLIWNIKYKKSEKAIDIGGYALFEEIKKISKRFNKNKIVIVPIPITKKRRKERGFNQCELLLEKMSELDIDRSFEYQKDFLIRILHRDRQTLKRRKDRLDDVKGAFDLNEKNLLDLITETSKQRLQTKRNNISIVVIDDVITTGSTIKEAMDVFRKAGFNQVIGISLAH